MIQFQHFFTFVDLHQIHTFRTNRSIQQRERQCSKVFVLLSILVQYDELIPAELQTLILLMFKFLTRLSTSSIFNLSLIYFRDKNNCFF